VALDQILDSSRTGPLFLHQPKLACLVMQALWDGQARMQRYPHVGPGHFGRTEAKITWPATMRSSGAPEGLTPPAEMYKLQRPTPGALGTC